jgi:PPOX class probable FMN-dependent enzyme
MSSFDTHPSVTVEALRALYGEPGEASIVKEIDHVSVAYRAFIEASPFAILATGCDRGLDCSPRGDAPGFVRVLDPKTLVIPDRRGNNRIDSLTNLAQDPRIAIIFLIPGCGETLRVAGRANVCIDRAVAKELAVDGKEPRALVIVHVERVYFQCSRAILRSRLWDPAQHVDRTRLPTVGSILAELTSNRLGGEPYDRALPERLKSELY